MLHRLGVDASLTLGNKTPVDIMVAHPKGQILTTDVTRLAGPFHCPADNIWLPARPRHFDVFVTFDGHITDPTHTPSAWIDPARSLQPFIKKYRTGTVPVRGMSG